MSGAGRRLVLWVAVAGAALVGVFLLLGGGRLAPEPGADPCVSRWGGPSGVEEILEQIVLSGLDGAACELGLTREALALAVADQSELDALVREQGIDDARLETILRVSLRRAVLDAQRSGALNPTLALIAGAAVDRLAVGELIRVVRSGRLDWLGAFVP